MRNWFTLFISILKDRSLSFASPPEASGYAREKSTRNASRSCNKAISFPHYRLHLQFIESLNRPVQLIPRHSDLNPNSSNTSTKIRRSMFSFNILPTDSSTDLARTSVSETHKTCKVCVACIYLPTTH